MTQKSNYDNKKEWLDRKLNSTKGARFEANRRFIKKNHVSLWSISLLSIYTIFLSLWQLISHHQQSNGQNITNIISIATIVISIFIIVLSILESIKNYVNRAEHMLKCSQQISEVYNKFKLYQDYNRLNFETEKEIIDKYDEILRDSCENHSQVDYNYFKAMHINDFKELQGLKAIPKRLLYWVSFYIDIYLFSIIVNFIPILLLFFLWKWFYK